MRRGSARDRDVQLDIKSLSKVRKSASARNSAQLPTGKRNAAPQYKAQTIGGKGGGAVETG